MVYKVMFMISDWVRLAFLYEVFYVSFHSTFLKVIFIFLRIHKINILYPYSFFKLEMENMSYFCADSPFVYF